MGVKMDEESGLTLVDEVVRSLNISRIYMAKLIERGYVQTVMIDGSLYISDEELDRFEAQRKIDKVELMEKFANQENIEQDAIDEISKMLE